MYGLPPRTEIERCYQILELDPDLSSALVDSSWRKLVDEWHPDRFVSDPILHARAHARVKELNRAHEMLKAYLGRCPGHVNGPSVRTGNVGRPRRYFRRAFIASTAIAGVTIAAFMIARPSSIEKDQPPPDSIASAAPTPEPSPAAAETTSEIQLVARAPLTVSVSLVANGRILLPETMLYAGQTTTIPRLGPTYIKYSAGENLAVKIDGLLYAMPDTGPNRAKIN